MNMCFWTKINIGTQITNFLFRLGALAKVKSFNKCKDLSVLMVLNWYVVHKLVTGFNECQLCIFTYIFKKNFEQ